MDDRLELLNEKDSDEIEINVVEIILYLLKRAWILVIAAMAGALIAGAYSVTMVTPNYEASSMIYVYSKSTSITSLADLQIGTQLAVDFQIVAKTREVINNVIDRLNLNTSYEGLLSSVSITNPQGSHILKITAINPDPQLAAEISNTLADELRARIADVMNTDEPSIVDYAVVPTSPSGSSTKRTAILGGLLAGFAMAAFFTVRFLMDDTIKTGDDVRKYLGQNVLAEIPLDKGARKKAG